MCKHWKISGSKLDDQLTASERRETQDDDRPVSRRRKDRKRWCRGKVGVDHQPVCMTHREAKGEPLTPAQENERFLVCKRCGREMECYFPGWLYPSPKPDWVTK